MNVRPMCVCVCAAALGQGTAPTHTLPSLSECGERGVAPSVQG